MNALLQQLTTETFILDIEDALTRAPHLEGYGVRLIAENVVAVDVEKEQGLNGLFELLQDNNILVRSMRNKSNRLEELFVSLVDKTLNQDNA